ncbi:D-alanine--D-alanine ligase family protein [Carnobacterium gallinarum]|uniref:D-alanine--D-alanine ligase family protein n=1 Tax=Carnobacterium gallinarum TaxID=2749 RepID=UPI00054EF362|nr:D-alanine--D-alanine ligase family protein [Carnobacterium gallinarum]
MTKKINVGVVFGGKSTEYEVSLQSAKNILETLDSETYQVHLFAFSNEGQLLNLKDSTTLLTEEIQPNESLSGVSLSHLIDTKVALDQQEIDVFFPILHGNLGEDGSLQGFFRMLNKPFVGSSVLSSALCMDKDFSKQIFNYNEFKTAKSLTVRLEDNREALVEKVVATLGFPVFIKPANQGSSIGVSRAKDPISFEVGIAEGFKFDNKLIIEEEIVGKEVECAVLGNEKPIASGLGSIATDNSKFYTYEEKYLDESGAILEIPAKISDSLTKEIQKQALAAYQLMECKGLARVDFFLTADNQIYLNEINTLPGFTNISMYPQLWKNAGLAYSELIETLLTLAIEEFQREEKLQRKVNLE